LAVCQWRLFNDRKPEAYVTIRICHPDPAVAGEESLPLTAGRDGQFTIKVNGCDFAVCFMAAVTFTVKIVGAKY